MQLTCFSDQRHAITVGPELFPYIDGAYVITIRPILTSDIWQPHLVCHNPGETLAPKLSWTPRTDSLQSSEHFETNSDFPLQHAQLENMTL